MNQTLKHLIFIAFFTLATTSLIWLPHYLSLSNFLGLNFSNGFNNIYRNFDGLEYIVIAKTAYFPSLVAGVPNALSANYYAAHFPGFPMLIFLFAPFLGFLKSMLFVSLLFTVLSAWAFYFLVRDFHLTKHPLFLTIVFLVLPARWVIIRSVGTSETMFIFFVIVSLYFFLKAIRINEELKPIPTQSFLWGSAIAGALAQLTRPPGNLLAASFGIFILFTTFKIIKEKTLTQGIRYMFSFYPLLLIPLTLLGIFYWFNIAYQDFFAYFHSGDNIHLTLPPFAVFNKDQFWVGSIWLEDIVYTFTLGFLGGLLLIKQKLTPIAIFVLTYLVASAFVAHRDISRYTYPIAPFVIIAFERVLTSREFKIVLVILSVAIYLYSQNFIIANTAPIPNLTPYN